MGTQVKDERLAEVEKELETLGFCAGNGSAEALALYYIVCELRLIRRSLEQSAGSIEAIGSCVENIYDYGNAIKMYETNR